MSTVRSASTFPQKLQLESSKEKDLTKEQTTQTEKEVIAPKLDNEKIISKIEDLERNIITSLNDLKGVEESSQTEGDTYRILDDQLQIK